LLALLSGICNEIVSLHPLTLFFGKIVWLTSEQAHFMRISINWLRELVDLTPEELAETLTLAGFEVEGRPSHLG